jgi:predicted O-linked N-acetylglucosamine transferase (SPINDLY family)
LNIDGPHADAYVNRGVALQKLQRHREAIECYDRAIALDPLYPLAHTNKAAALEEQGQLNEALASYDNSLKLQPSPDAWSGRSVVLQQLRRFDEALFALKQVHALDPARPYLQGEILHLKMQMGEWDNFAQHCEALFKNIDKGLKAAAPGYIIALPSSLEHQQRAAQTYACDKFPARPTTPLAARPADRRKIAIGYFSCDFHNHPVSQLAAGLFECHDREEFTIFGFSYGGRRDDAYARRIALAMDRFIDVSAMSDPEVAALSRSLEVDIAVDLTGQTFNARLGIFANRAAPVQATYLGYPGTSGCSFFDHIIADQVVIPSADARFFTERPFYIPISFQANDSARAPVREPKSRSAYGLPENGFVYCCFNAGYKLTPDVFAIWMRLLQRIDGSVLWLLANNATFIRNLRKRAQQSGVAPERIVFAERADLGEYLSRQQCADLALDTFYYNGHTTTSDALWAGLPVITREGSTFAGRVASSLLQAIGLPDLVTRTAEEYEELAFRLATDKELLGSIKQRLDRNRATTSLFDTAAFTRHLEAAYRTISLCGR